MSSGLQKIGGLYNSGALINRSSRSWPSTGLDICFTVDERIEMSPVLINKAINQVEVTS
jgi:hypothetical protein